MTALDEAIALIDSLCGKLTVDRGASTAAPGAGAAKPAAPAAAAAAPQVAPPVAKPWTALASSTVPADGAAPAAGAASAAAAAPKAAKAKKMKQPAPPAEPQTTEDLFDKAMLQVARVVSVEALESSEKLYKTKVEVAGGETRQIVAGLRRHVEQQELEGSLVVVILNLKTARLAGEASEGMILAGVQTDAALPNGELVRPIRPQSGATAGTRVFLQGGAPSAAPPKTLKSAPWAQVKELLRVVGGVATFDGKALVTEAGPVTVADLPDGAAIS